MQQHICEYVIPPFVINVDFDKKQMTIKSHNLTIHFDELYIVYSEGIDCHMIVRQNNLCLYLFEHLQLFFCDNKIREFRNIEDDCRVYMIDDKSNYYLLEYGVVVKDLKPSQLETNSNPYSYYDNANLCIYSNISTKQILPEYTELNEFKRIMSESNSPMKNLMFNVCLKYEYLNMCNHTRTSDDVYPKTFDKFVSLTNEFGRFVGFELMNMKTYWM